MNQYPQRVWKSSAAHGNPLPRPPLVAPAKRGNAPHLVCQTGAGRLLCAYYLRGVIAQRRGWMDEAAQNFRIAVNMEPQNLEYRNALSSVGSGAYTYRQTQYSDGSDELCGLCSSLMCLNCLCGGCR